MAARATQKTEEETTTPSPSAEDIFGYDPFKEETKDSEEEEQEEEQEEEEEEEEKETEEEEEEKDEEKETEEEKDEEDEEDEDEDEEDEEEDDEDEDEDENEEDDDSTEVALLRKQLDEQSAIILDLQSKMLKPASDSKSEEDLKKQAEEEEKESQYDIGVPDQIVQAVLSGDETQVKAALQSIVSGVAQITHKRVSKVLQDRFTRQLTETKELEVKQSDLKTYQQKLLDDFYGTYPGYDNAKLHKLVGAVAREYADKHPGETWGPKMRDGIAEGVKEIVKFSGKADPAKANRRGRKSSKTSGKGKTKKLASKGKSSSKKAAKKNKPPRQVGSGSRVMQSEHSGTENLESDIVTTFKSPF